MKRTAKQCLYGLVICALIAGTVRAQDDGSGSARVSDQPGPLPAEPTPVFVGEDGPPTGFFPMNPVETWFAPRFYVDSRAGVLYGYEESFTNLGGFVPYFLDENSMLFADARGLVGYDGRGGANGGVGWRYYMPEYDRFIGFNAFYDFDASHIREYHQAGVGFESVGRYFDLLVNGYIPVGTQQNMLSTSLLGPAQFVGNGLFLDRYNEIEAAFTGFDAQIGGPMPIFGRYGLQGYVGFYFFDAPSETDFTGVSGRLAWQINEDWNIAVNMTDDHVFGTNTQMQVSVTLPDGKSSRWLRPLSVRDRMMQSVQRNYRVTVEQEIKIVQEAALNPKDGLPYFVVHVDPNAAASGVNAGDGTVENPYSRLSQFDNLALANKSAVDIIYVEPRFDLGVSNSTNLNQGVTLLTGQRLLSNSVTHQFETVQRPGVLFDLPGFVPGGQDLPVLSNNGGGNVVTFADGAICMEVSGFTINGSATGRGIAGTNNQNVLINRNVIQNGLDGIALTNLTGLQANDRGSFIQNNIIRNNLNDGINVSNSGVAPLDLVIANNAPTNIDFDGVIDTDLDGDGVNDSSAPDSLDGDASFANDGINSNGDDGIDVNADAASVINLAISANQIRGNQDNGIEIDATAAGTVFGSIINNAITGNRDNGILLTADNATLDFLNISPSGLQGEISGNEIRDNTDDGIEIVAVQSQTSFDIHTNRFGISTFDLTDPLLTLGPNGGWGVNLNAEGGETLIVIGGPTAADGNIFFDPGFGAVVYNLTGDNLTTSNIEFNQVLSAVAAGGGGGTAFRTGFNQFTLARNDDFSTALVPVGFNGNFFGLNFSQVFVNNNGNITFNQALGQFTPFNISTNATPIIAPFFADVDTRLNGQPVTYGTGVINGRQAFGVNWDDVDYFPSSVAHGTQLNSFQLVLIDRSDIAPGDFDFEFNYDQILWETGGASGGTNGLGGSSARAGYSNGSTATLELTGSGIPNSFLDSSPAATSLVQNSLNSPINGRYVFQARNGTVLGGGGGGVGPNLPNAGAILLNVSDTAQLNNSFVQNNTVIGQTNANGNQFALSVNTTGLGRANNLVIRNNTFNQNDGGIQFTRSGSSLINAMVNNNIVNQNTNTMVAPPTGTGWEINASGTALGGVFVTSQDNTFDQNGVDGLNITAVDNSIVSFESLRDAFTNSGDDNIQTRTADSADLNLDFQNVVATGATSNGYNGIVEGTSVTLINISSPVDPNAAANPRSTFSNNGLAGFQLNASENGLASVAIDDTLFDSNTLDGVNFNREAASLILATISDSDVTGNGDDGIQFYTTGASVLDPTTPLFNGGIAPANRLILTNVTVDGQNSAAAPNGANGLELATMSDSMLVVNAALSRFTNNAADGVRVFSGGTSSFGNVLTGERSTFSGVTMSNNGLDGFRAFVQGIDSTTPTSLIEINSSLGDTNISSNGDDGIEGSVTYGDLDILVNGDTLGVPNFNTLIQLNGQTSMVNGNGIEFNVGDGAADGDTTTGANSIAQFFFPNPLNGTNTFQITQAPADAVRATGTLTVNNTIIGDENLNNANNTGNGGDGIEVFGSIVSNYTARFLAGSPNGGSISTLTSFIPDAVAIVSVNENDISGNGQHGVNFTGDSGTSPGTFDTDGFSDITSPSVQFIANVTGNTINSNATNGINIDLEGRYGITVPAAVGTQNARLFGNNFVIDNNVIQRNGRHGVFFQSNASDQAFAQVDFQDPAVPPIAPATNRVFNPLLVGADEPFLFNFDTSGIAGQFLDVSTDANTNMVFTRNDVRFNGGATPNVGEGVFIRVSTNSYLGLDFGGAAGSGLGNTFSGNTNSDVRIESFVAFNPITGVFEVPPQSIEGTAPAQDVVFLDHTSQLDLRFNNNVGADAAAPFAFQLGQDQAAFYQNFDPNKQPPGSIRRFTQLFQLDDAFNVDANNTWNAQNLLNVFSNGNFFLRTVADPAFPNPAFPENFATDPGDPFLP